MIPLLAIAVRSWLPIDSASLRMAKASQGSTSDKHIQDQWEEFIRQKSTDSRYYGTESAE